jgi:membrane protease YdiL (CAAX protease family)
MYNDQVTDQPSLPLLILLHLAPGAIFTVLLVLTAPAVRESGFEPSLALFGGIGLVVVPLELGYLAAYARQRTGSWSPLDAVDYRGPVAGRRLALLAASLAVWFLTCLVLSMAFLEHWLLDRAFAWVPDALREFAVVQTKASAPPTEVLVTVLLSAFLFNGIAGPITEELYFRGHLLPRLERYGRWAPVLNTVLFALYHFFSPWRYPAIIVGFLPITWAAWRDRSVLVSIAAHMTINLVTMLLLVATLAAGR